MFSNVKNLVIVIVSFFSLFMLIYFSPLDTEQLAFAHFFSGGNDASFNGTQTQTIGNYTVELLVNPSKPIIDRTTSFLFRLTSNAGDVLIELPVSFYFFKDGMPVFSNPNNFTLVSQGHYDFNYTFSKPGKYLLFVDIKDIFYTLDIVNVMFEVDVGVPVIERILNLLKAFLIKYYYIYIPFIALIELSIAVNQEEAKM